MTALFKLLFAPALGLALLTACSTSPAVVPDAGPMTSNVGVPPSLSGNFKRAPLVPPLGTVTVFTDGQQASVDLRSLTAKSAPVQLKVLGTKIRPSHGEQGDDLWITLDVYNTGSQALQDLTFFGLHQAEGGLLGSAFVTLKDAEGADTPNPMLARQMRPGMARDLDADWPGADFQAFGEGEASKLQERAQEAGVIALQDTVLGYGFTAQRPGGRRQIGPGEHAQVRLSFHLPPNTAAQTAPKRLGWSLLLAGDHVTRVTRATGETTAQAMARATGTLGTTQVVLVGQDKDQSGPAFTAVRLAKLRQTAALSGQLFGVIQPDARRMATDHQAGLRVRTLELAWDRAQPADGRWDEAYLESKRAEYWASLRAGFEVVLELGIQYPPDWVKRLPNAQFVDQQGAAYTSDEPGANPVNAVFNAEVRAQQADFVRKVFQELGDGFYAVRLGWGRYGELGYPPVKASANSYWAYDALAQGRVPGLPAGIQAAPLRGWKPVTAGASASRNDQAEAQAFLDWYLGSLQNYHDWQIGLLRSVYAGRLFMLYPSFGVRPGQLERAAMGGLNGSTSPEINTEIQRGFDFGRFVTGIQDPLVSPYTTWLDADGFFVNDASADPAAWSPAHYLSRLANTNPLNLSVWGENTGRNNLQAMRLCGERLQAYNLGGMFWAFNAELYDQQHATINDYSAIIQRQYVARSR